VEANAVRELTDVGIGVGWALPSHEVLQLPLWNTEIGRGGVGSPLLVGRVNRSLVKVVVDDRPVLAVTIEDVLNLVAEDEPEIVDPIVAQGHADDRFGR
jgi:hypothetical protein